MRLFLIILYIIPRLCLGQQLAGRNGDLGLTNYASTYVSVPILDKLGVSPVAAYSLRRLRTAYTGPAIRIRRGDTNAETDIGFNADGTLNTVALISAVGVGNSGYVTAWYDQSGNANNATQDITTNQPQIIISGNLQTISGRPCIRSFVGASLTVPIGNATPPFSLNGIGATSSASTSDQTISGLGNNGSPIYGAAVKIDIGPVVRSTLYGIVDIGSMPISLNSLVIITSTTSINNTNFYGNGNLIASTTQNPTAGSSTSLICSKGVYLCESLIFRTALSTDQRKQLERNQGSFYKINSN